MDISHIQSLLTEIGNMIDDLEWQLNEADEMDSEQLANLYDKLKKIRDEIPLEVCP